MGHPFDANLMFYTGKDVTTDESVGPLTVWGQVERGLAVRLVVEDAYGANDTLLPIVHLSADNSTYNLVAQYHKGAIKVDGGYEFLVPFICPPGKWYVKLELSVTVASTTPLFTDVFAGIVPNVGDVFQRANHFE